MRAAVYNAHWSTLGGGEQLAGGLAAALARVHDVDLLVSEPFDAARASERLGFDLTGFPQVELAHGTRAFLDATERYELVANTSFGSTFPSRARRSLYYVHFPFPNRLAEPPPFSIRRVVRPESLLQGVEREEGFWLREFAGAGSWTRGRARIDVSVPPGVTLPFRLDLSAAHWPPGQAPHVRVVADDAVLHDGVVGRTRLRLRTMLTGRGVDAPLPVEIESDTFVPRLVDGSDDDRELGVVVSHVALGRRLPSNRPRDLLRLGRVAPVVSTQFLDSYSAVVANSPYTARWVRELWDHDAVVVAPPVRARRAGEKLPIILSVGRFFPPDSGHSKKQLELVEAFRIACARGLDGWELHLAGGCSHDERHYLERVRRAAVGLPVRFHVNARGSDLDALFAGASLFWHGGGLGEDPETHPDRFEHFGISVIEAMSAGAVPIVHRNGGPAALVEAGRIGEVHATPDDLATHTLRLVRDPDEVQRRSRAAVLRAADFGFDEFARAVDQVVDEVSACRSQPTSEPT